MAVQSDGKILAAGRSDGTDTTAFSVVRYNTDGSLDTTFDSDGKAIVTFGSANDFAFALAVNPADGKITAGGGTQSGSSGQDFALVRWSATGGLDTSFDSDGKVSTDLSGSGNDSANALVQQGDGKLVAAGKNSGNFAVARYFADGSLDESFGTAGRARVDFSNRIDEAYGVAVQADGKVVAAGVSFGVTSRNDLAVARFQADGTVDTAFGSSGKILLDIELRDDRANAVTVDANDKILVVGYTLLNGSSPIQSDILLLRYNSDGTPDSSFGTGGMVRTSVGNWDEGNDLVLAPDGKILVAANVDNSTKVLRYLSDGTLDTSFGSGGVAAGSSRNAGHGITLLADGRIVAVGGTMDVSLARFSANGTPDATFGIGGIANTSLSGENPRGWDVAVGADGKLLAVAFGTDFVLTRHNDDGSLDTSFGSGGVVRTDFQGGMDRSVALLVQPGGGIVVAGTAQIAGRGYDFALARYQTADSPPLAGDLDPSFDVDGKVTTKLPDFSSTELGQAAAVQADGKVVVVGGSGSDFVVARYHAQGGLDHSFGVQGKVSTDFAGDYDDARAVAIQADGKIVVAGFVGSGTDQDIGVARYLSDGSLDMGFGRNGRSTVNTGTSELGFGIALQPDGKIVVVGRSYPGGGTSGDFAVVRFNSDGTPDPDFGTDGAVTTDFPGSGSYEDARDVAIQADGKIVVVGSTNSGGTTDMAVVRYNPDGSLDVSFGAGSSQPREMVTMNGALYFTAYTPTEGIELWKSDGSTGGTTLLKDIRSGTASSSPTNLTVVGTTLYFRANDGTNGAELWKSDGTVNGTLLVKDISPGASASAPADLVNLGGTLYFRATDGTSGRELWKTNGTGAGTARVANIRADSASSSPDKLTNVNGTLFFEANEGTNGRELWKTDGTSGGTVLVKDINAGGANSSPTGLTVLGSNVYFAATDDTAGEELWKSDGSSGGTVRVKDIVTAGFALVTLDPGGVGASAVAESVAIQPDGKIVVGGWQGGNSSGSFQLARLNPNGTLDSSFGSGGMLSRMVSGTQYNSAYDIALQPDGKIVQVGEASFSGDRNFVIWRYNADGSTDEIHHYWLDSAQEAANAVAVRDDGTIVVAGFSSIDNISDFAMFVVNSDLSLATGFSRDGLKTTDFHGGFDQARDVLVQPDGKIVVAGTITDGSGQLRVGVSRYTNRGELDPTFNTNGTTSIYLGTDDLIGEAAALQADGKLLVAGTRETPTRNWGLLVRLDTNGLLDSTFDTDGLRDFGFPGTTDQDVAHAVAVQADGKIVVAGASTTAGDSTLSVYRFLTSGQFDTSFGNNGGKQIDFGSSSDIAWSAAVQPDGKLLLAGESAGNFALVRLLADGSLDTSLDTDGLVTTDFAGGADQAYSLTLQPDGWNTPTAWAARRNGEGWHLRARRPAHAGFSALCMTTAWTA